MITYQTNINEYTSVFHGFMAKGRTHVEAMMACLWKAREARVIYLSIN